MADAVLNWVRAYVTTEDGVISQNDGNLIIEANIKNNSKYEITSVSIYRITDHTYGVLIWGSGSTVSIKSGKTSTVQIKCIFHGLQTQFSARNTENAYISDLSIKYSNGTKETVRSTISFNSTTLGLEPRGELIEVYNRSELNIAIFELQRAQWNAVTHEWALSEEGEGAICRLKCGQPNEKWLGSYRAFIRSDVTQQTAITAVTGDALWQNETVLSYAQLIGLPQSEWGSEAANPFPNGSDINVELVLTTYDDHIERTVETVTSAWTLFAGITNVHFSGNPAGGVAFGKFCDDQKAPAFECEYKAYLSGGIDALGVTSYSADEVLTGGTWTDGKPIYARTAAWEGTMAAGGEKLLFDMGIGVQTLVKLEGFARRSTDGTLFPLGGLINTTINAPAFWQSDHLVVRNNGFACDCIYATIYYTKTTD